VQAFTLEPLQSRRFADAVDTSFQTSVRRIRVRALLTAVAILAIFSAVTLVLWIGAQAVLAGEMTAGELGQFLLYAIFVAGGAASLSEMWGEVQRAAGATERLMELLTAEPRVTAPATPVGFADADGGRIALERVSFTSASRSPPARRSRSSGRRAPANRRCFSCCCVSMTRKPDESSSTASTSAWPGPRSCASV
jgi:ATP-binding cassette subfamily B protein